MRINIHSNQMDRGADNEGQAGGNPERDRPRGGIDIHRVQMGAGTDQNPQPERARPFWNRVVDNPERRAQRATEAARLQAVRTRDEALKQRGIAEARNALRQAAQGEPAAMQTPDLDGAAATLARIALSDPKRARQLALAIGKQTLNHNMMAVTLIEQRAVHEASAPVVRQRFAEKPVSNDIDLTRIDWLKERERDGVLKRVTKGTGRAIASVATFATNVASRPALTALNSLGLSEEEQKQRKKEPPHVLDTIRLDGSGVHVSAPFHPNLPEVTIGPNNAAQFQIQTNPPPWADGVVGILAMAPKWTRSRVLRKLPFGEVVVTHSTMGTIARAPALFPGRLEAEIKSGIAAMAPWTKPIPDFRPLPSDPDLLRRAAAALGQDMDELPEIPDVPATVPSGGGFLGWVGGLFGKK